MSRFGKIVASVKIKEMAETIKEQTTEIKRLRGLLELYERRFGKEITLRDYISVELFKK